MAGLFPLMALHGKVVNGSTQMGDQQLWIDFTDGTSVRINYGEHGLVVEIEDEPDIDQRGRGAHRDADSDR